MFATIMGMEGLPLIQNARSRAIMQRIPTEKRGREGWRPVYLDRPERVPPVSLP